MIKNVVMATTNKFQNAGQSFQFSIEDLLTMSKTAVGATVTLDFNRDAPLGKILESSVEDNKLTAKIEVNLPDEVEGKLYCVPSYELPSKRFVEAAITHNPAQKDLPAI